MPSVTTSTPDNAPRPIGPHSHIARVGDLLTIGGIAGVDQSTGALIVSEVGSQTRQILKITSALLESANSDLEHVMQVNVFFVRMDDFAEMNEAYAECPGAHRPSAPSSE
jgi:2-iminobutanoate/2-iminopropanoate deaminase